MNHGVDVPELEEIVSRHGRERRYLIPILQEVQQRFAYLPEQALAHIAEATDNTRAQIHGVATFYSQFRLRPAGRHSIKVCVGTACHVMGAELIFDAFRRHLQIAETEDTDDQRLFTIYKVGCLGCCMLAPAVQIDRVTYGFVRPDTVGAVLKDFLASESEAAAPADHAWTRGGQARGEVRLCLCSSCGASGARRVRDQLLKEIDDNRLPVTLKSVSCTGMAYLSPTLEIQPKGGQSFRYGRVKPQDVSQILHTHFRPRSLSRRLGAAISRALNRLYSDDAWEPVTRFAVDVRSGPDAAYGSAQTHIATAGCGEMAPLDLDEYLRRGGFAALRESLMDLTPQEIVERVEESGLRGRGGAGFPTAPKWHAVRRARVDDAIVICNGDEGDPGAFMDRMLLESFPFRVIEGMVIASVAVGASRGFFYIRSEYPVAVSRIFEALAACGDHHLVGDDILGSGHSFHVEVVEGAGAFVCGEETALMAAIEGGRGVPRPRPPFPAECGLWGEPTLINNVETLALVPAIVSGGGRSFAEVGQGSSTGTKCFALAGKIARSGLIEVAMGTTLRQIVDDVGGGVRDGKRLKAIQVGGPSGGCVPAWLADTPVHYESLTALGAMMGSGGMVVLDEDDCMVEIARYFMAFTQAESCGACTFCRVGTTRMLEILERLCGGCGRDGDIERLEELAKWVASGSLCGLGRTAPNPVTSVLTHFREEVEAHVAGRCPAGRCTELIDFVIGEECIGCTTCAQRCPCAAIEPMPYELHVVDLSLCSRCGTCHQVCPVDAVHAVSPRNTRPSESKNGTRSNLTREGAVDIPYHTVNVPAPRR